MKQEAFAKSKQILSPWYSTDMICRNMSNTLEHWLCVANQKQLPKEKAFEDAPSNKKDS